MPFTTHPDKPSFNNKASLWLGILQFRVLTRRCSVCRDRCLMNPLSFLRPRNQRLRKVN